MIPPDEEAVLTRLIRAGDQAALHRLTSANLRFVVSVSKKFQHQGLPLIDLISEGNLGLIKAAHRFDESRGFKFISYAVWWIRQGILQAIAEQSRSVRLPLNQLGALSNLNKTFSRLEQEYEREPSVEELAEAMELSAAHVADIVSNSRRQLSLDAPMGNEAENSLLEMLTSGEKATDDTLINESVSIMVKRALGGLPEREQTVLILFFGIGQSQSFTLEEIASRYRLTRERVRQIKDKALAHLRHQSRAQALMKGLED